MIITTVGTSLFSNYQKDDVRNHYGRDYQSIDNPLKRLEKENPTATEIYSLTYKHYIEEIQEVIEDFWLEHDDKPNTEASAEIAGILKIVQESTAQKLIVHLIATDTVLSVLASEMIVKWFENHKHLTPNISEVLFQRPQPDFVNQSESNYVIKYLRVDSQLNYERGFNNLIEVLDIIYQAKNKKTPFVLNITGGYKAIVPVITLYGQLREIPLKYIYDEEDLNKNRNLVTVGNLPFSFDWGLIEALKPFLNIGFHPLWQNEGKELVELFFEEVICFDPVNEVFRSKLEHDKSKVSEKIKELFVIKHLLDHKLLSFFKEKNEEGIEEKKIILSPIGMLLNKAQKEFNYQLDSYRGLQIEYLLYKYFAGNEKDEKIKSYTSTIPFTLNGSFRVENGKVQIKENQAKDDWRAFGDIDLPLKKNNVIVLGECKAFSTFQSYANEKSGTKYFEQIRARLQRFVQQYPDKMNSEKPELEFLFIVFEFQFSGFEQKILSRQTVQQISRRFEELEKIELLTSSGKKVTPYFNLIGLRCLIELNHRKLTANYSAFYQNPRFSWETYSQTDI